MTEIHQACIHTPDEFLFPTHITIGSHYTLAGHIQYGSLQTTTYDDGSIRFNETGNSIWAFQFDSAWRQQIAQGIASKSQRDAISWLTQHGANGVNVIVSGLWGTALPSDWHNIHL